MDQFGIPQAFCNQVASALAQTIEEGRPIHPWNQPYAAILYSLPNSVALSEIADKGTEVGRMRNRRGELNNHNAHAEQLLLHLPEVAAQLTENHDNPNLRSTFVIFTNTPSCIGCLGGIINAQIQNIFYFVETEDADKLPRDQVTGRSIHARDIVGMYAGKVAGIQFGQLACDERLKQRLANQQSSEYWIPER